MRPNCISYISIESVFVVKITLSPSQFLKGAAVFLVVGGALAGIFFALGSTDLLSWSISGYAGLFAVYILARNGVFSPRVFLLLHGETERQSAKLRKVPSRRGGQTVSEPIFLTSVEAENKGFSPNMRVIGVPVGGKAVAFPLLAMAVSESAALPSDTSRGSAVSWWPVTFSARAFEKSITPEPYVVHNAAIFTDEDGVKRLQFDGQDLSAKKGEQPKPPIRRIPTVLTTWQAWREAYPETKVFFSEGLPDQDIFEGYYVSPRAGIFPERSRDVRLAGKEVVIGIETQNESMAWAYSALRSGGVRNEVIDRVAVLVAFDEFSATACVFERRAAGRTLTFEIENPATDIKVSESEELPADDATDAEGGDESTLTEEVSDYEPMILIDKETGSRWHFMTGECLEGAMKGATLRRLDGMTAFWFAWHKFHPHTDLYTLKEEVQPA